MEPKEQFEKVMDLMVQAGWLKSYTLTEGKGFRLNWTPTGGAIAFFMKGIANRYGLDGDDRAPLCFDKSSQGLALPAGVTPVGTPEKSDTILWNANVKALKIERTEDDLLAMVHVFLGWAPTMDSEISFG